MTSSRNPLTFVPVLALLATVGLTACGGGKTAKEVKPLTPSQAVRAAAIDVGDLPSGFTAEPFPAMGSDVLRGEPSMELCWPALKFASERERLARHSTRYALPGGNGGMNYEFVFYKVGGAEHALQEVRAAVDSWPDTYVPFPAKDTGLPPSKLVLEELEASDDWFQDSVAVRQTEYFKGESEPVGVDTIVYQRRGDLLSILTFRTQESADEYLAEVAALQAERLGGVEL